MSVARGIALKVISTAVFTGMSALIGLMAQHRYPTGEIVFFRSLFALVPLFAWLWWSNHIRDAFTIRSMSGHLKRCISGAASMFFGFLALGLMPLADAVAIGYASPLIVVIFAGAMLGETVSRARWISVMIGLVGVFIILSPHLDMFGVIGGQQHSALGALAAFIGAVATSFAVIQIRQITRTETAASIIMMFMLTCAVLSLASIPFGWVMPTWQDALVLVFIGVLGGIGQIMITVAYRYADASLLVSFDYVSMVWAVLFGLLISGYFPGLPVLVGSGIVIASSLWLIYAERGK